MSACVTPGERDPATWPFDRCSPWNHPLGSAARYDTIEPDVPHEPLWDKYGSYAKNWTTIAWINVTDSHPIFVEGGKACHEASVQSNNDGEGHAANVRTCLPDDTAPARECYSGSGPTCPGDHHLHLVDTAHRSVLEMYQAVPNGNGFVASAAIRNSLLGLGVFKTESRCYWHGTRAYGGSAIGGLIRKGELRHGIFHAVAVALPSQAMNRNGPNNRPWVWPASCADGDSDSDYGTTGNVYMGTLLAIPPQVDLADVAPNLRTVAVALQTYGAYVVDQGSHIDKKGFPGGVGYYAEPDDPDAIALRADENTYRELGKVTAKLRVVSNNAPGQVGGGGAPLTCFAPEFSRRFN